MHPLIADGGELTVLRSLASYAYGTWAVTWPSTVPDDQKPEIADDQDFGYAARLRDAPGRMGRRFVRANVSITAAEYSETGAMVPFSGRSDVERVLDDAVRRTDGDALFQQDFDRSALGALVPRVDFDVDDIVPVLIWNRVLMQPVTLIEDKVEAGAVVDWRVHVGGALVEDDAARERDIQDREFEIMQERRERLEAVGSVSKVAASAKNTAESAKSKVDSVAADVASIAAKINSLTSADGKSTNFYGAEDPVAGGAKPNPGDTWFRDNTDGSITILVFDGAKGWVEAVPEVDFSEVNARLGQARADVDKAKRDVAAALEDVAAVESLVAKKVDTSAYDSAMAENRRRLQSLDVDLANKINRGDVKPSDLVAEAVVAGKVAAGAISAREIAAGSITGNEIAANTIAASRLAIAAGNLFPDPHFQDPCWDVSANVYRKSDNDGEFDIFANGRQIGAYYRPADMPADGAIMLEPDTAYRLTSTVYTTTGVTQLSVYMRWVRGDGTAALRRVGDFDDLPDGVSQPAIMITTPADMRDGRCTLGFFLQRTQTEGMASMWNMKLTRAADGNLIVDGAILAKHIKAGQVTTTALDAKAVTAAKIDTDAITAEKIKAGALTSDKMVISDGFIKTAMIGDLQVTDAKIYTINAYKITAGYLDAARIAAGSISTEKLAANSITTAKLAIVPGNIFPDPHFRDPCWGDVAPVKRGAANGGELNIFAGGVQYGTYYQPAGVSKDKALLFEPGAAYRVSSTVWTSTGVTTASVYMRYETTSGSTRIVRLGTWDNLPNGVSQQSFNCIAPSNMRDGSATVGFYLESTQKSGQLSLWNTQITRAADSNLIVNGAIKAEHIAADTITARQVNADEIFLKADGDQSLKAQYDDLRLGMTYMQSAVSYLTDRLESKTARRSGIGAIGSNYEILGSRETQSLFSASSGRLIATGTWKGRVAIINSYVDGNYGLVCFFGEIDAATRSVTAPTDRKYDPVFMYEIDPVTPTAYTLRPSSNWDAPKSRWTTVPGMSVTLPTGTESYSITGQVTFTNVNRGSTYGVRVLVNGAVVSNWSSTSFGPLGPLGDPTWSVNVTAAGDSRGGQKLEVQVYCSNSSASKRRVTTASSMKATAYVTG